jgi:hypothetical protein
MPAAFITEPGVPEAIQVGELPVPVPGPTVVLVVKVPAVNPADTFIRSGRYPTPMPLPFVLGRDLVGTVTAVTLVLITLLFTGTQSWVVVVAVLTVLLTLFLVIGGAAQRFCRARSTRISCL